MCQTALYKDAQCKHRWMRISFPCFPGAGFTTCPSFSYNNTHNRSNGYSYNHSYNYHHYQQPPGLSLNDGLCHQPTCLYQQRPHRDHYTPNHSPSAPFSPPFSPTFAPSSSVQGPGPVQGQIQGHNTCNIYLPNSPYQAHQTHQTHQVQVQHNCPHHQHLVAKPAPPAYIARSEPCPVCDLGGEYDRNQIRMITGIRNGVKLGGGPSGGDPGVELRCCVM